MVEKRSPAVDVAREQEPETSVLLSTGYRAKIKPVAASLIQEVTSRIEDPAIPVWHDPNKDRDVPNPMDPGYTKGLARANRLRGEAAIDALIMFGVELLDPIPDSEEWLDKLRFLEKRGTVDLTGYDLDSPLEVEFLFKRFIAVASPDLEKVSRATGVTEGEIARAASQFPRTAERNADRGVSDSQPSA